MCMTASFRPLHIPPFVYTYSIRIYTCTLRERRRKIHGESSARARALARFHSYSRPVTTSRIIRPSGITNDVEGTPQAPPPLLHTLALFPQPITPLLSSSYCSCSRARNRDPAATPLRLLHAGVHLQLVAESIRRNVALTGSYGHQRQKPASKS